MESPMTIAYVLAGLLVAVLICTLAGTKRPWIAQFSFAAMAMTSIATASKITPIVDGVYVSVAIGLYSMTFMLANYLREIFGKPFAVRAIWMGFIGELLFVFATQFSLVTPSAPFWQNQGAFEAVYSVTPRLFIASVLAYVSAEFTDVNVYHAIYRLTRGRHLWLRNNVGTIVGQVVDSILFYTIAFLGVVPNLLALIATTLAVKVVIAVVDTPAIYLVRYLAHLRGAAPDMHQGSEKLAAL
jgi:queuosine precursor transporter